MPTGSFGRGVEPYSDRTGMTGTGPASQPTTTTRWDAAPGTGGSTTTRWGPAPGSAEASPSGGTFYGPAGGGTAATNRDYGSTRGMPGYGGTNPLAGAQSLADIMYGPQSQLLADQLARQQDQLAMVGLDTKHQTSVLNRDNALAMQSLGLDRESLGLESGLISGQKGNLAKLRDILGSQRGLVTEQKGLDTDKSKDLASRAQWDLRSDLTQRGAFNTVANERGTGRINRDLDYQLRGIDQTFRNQMLGLDEKSIGYDNQLLSLNNRLAGIGLDAKRLNISEQQLNNALADGIYNAGLSGQTTINGLMDMITGTNAQQAQLATTVLGAVLQYSNLPPDVLAAINKALGVPGPGSGQSSGPGATLPGSRVPK